MSKGLSVHKDNTTKASMMPLLLPDDGVMLFFGPPGTGKTTAVNMSGVIEVVAALKRTLESVGVQVTDEKLKDLVLKALTTRPSHVAPMHGGGDAGGAVAIMSPGESPLAVMADAAKQMAGKMREQGIPEEDVERAVNDITNIVRKAVQISDQVEVNRCTIDGKPLGVETVTGVMDKGVTERPIHMPPDWMRQVALSLGVPLTVIDDAHQANGKTVEEIIMSRGNKRIPGVKPGDAQALALAIMGTLTLTANPNDMFEFPPEVMNRLLRWAMTEQPNDLGSAALGSEEYRQAIAQLDENIKTLREQIMNLSTQVNSNLSLVNGVSKIIKIKANLPEDLAKQAVLLLLDEMGEGNKDAKALSKLLNEHNIEVDEQMVAFTMKQLSDISGINELRAQMIELSKHNQELAQYEAQRSALKHMVGAQPILERADAIVKVAEWFSQSPRTLGSLVKAAEILAGDAGRVSVYTALAYQAMGHTDESINVISKFDAVLETLKLLEGMGDVPFQEFEEELTVTFNMPILNTLGSVVEQEVKLNFVPRSTEEISRLISEVTQLKQITVSSIEQFSNKSAPDDVQSMVGLVIASLPDSMKKPMDASGDTDALPTGDPILATDPDAGIPASTRTWVLIKEVLTKALTAMRTAGYKPNAVEAITASVREMLKYSLPKTKTDMAAEIAKTLMTVAKNGRKTLDFYLSIPDKIAMEGRLIPRDSIKEVVVDFVTDNASSLQLDDEEAIKILKEAQEAPPYARYNIVTSLITERGKWGSVRRLMTDGISSVSLQIGKKYVTINSDGKPIFRNSPKRNLGNPPYYPAEILGEPKTAEDKKQFEAMQARSVWRQGVFLWAWEISSSKAQMTNMALNLRSLMGNMERAQHNVLLLERRLQEIIQDNNGDIKKAQKDGTYQQIMQQINQNLKQLDTVTRELEQKIYAHWNGQSDISIQQKTGELVARMIGDSMVLAASGFNELDNLSTSLAALIRSQTPKTMILDLTKAAIEHIKGLPGRTPTHGTYGEGALGASVLLTMLSETANFKQRVQILEKTLDTLPATSPARERVEDMLKEHRQILDTLQEQLNAAGIPNADIDDLIAQIGSLRLGGKAPTGKAKIDSATAAAAREMARRLAYNLANTAANGGKLRVVANGGGARDFSQVLTRIDAQHQGASDKTRAELIKQTLGGVQQVILKDRKQEIQLPPKLVAKLFQFGSAFYQQQAQEASKAVGISGEDLGNDRHGLIVRSAITQPFLTDTLRRMQVSAALSVLSADDGNKKAGKPKAPKLGLRERHQTDVIDPAQAAKAMADTLSQPGRDMGEILTSFSGETFGVLIGQLARAINTFARETNQSGQSKDDAQKQVRMFNPGVLASVAQGTSVHKMFPALASAVSAVIPKQSQITSSKAPVTGATAEAMLKAFADARENAAKKSVEAAAERRRGRGRPKKNS